MSLRAHRMAQAPQWMGRSPEQPAARLEPRSDSDVGMAAITRAMTVTLRGAPTGVIRNQCTAAVVVAAEAAEARCWDNQGGRHSRLKQVGRARVRVQLCAARQHTEVERLRWDHVALPMVVMPGRTGTR